MKTIIRKAITAITEGVFVISLSALCCIGGEPCGITLAIFGCFAASGVAIGLINKAGWEI